MPTATLTVSREGHATIPADVLEHCGIWPGEQVAVSFAPAALPDLSGRTVDDIIAEYETRHGLSSSELQRKLASGEIDEDPELCRWVGMLKLRETVREDRLDSETVTFELVSERT